MAITGLQIMAVLHALILTSRGLLLAHDSALSGSLEARHIAGIKVMESKLALNAAGERLCGAQG
jgi:hypothetical protein